MSSTTAVTCTRCGGAGSYQAMGVEPCGSCAGTGRDTRSDCWAEPCRFCNGRGRVPYCRSKICDACRGRGKLNVW